MPQKREHNICENFTLSQATVDDLHVTGEAIEAQEDTVTKVMA